MHILFIIPYVPNLIRTRPYNLLRGIQQRGHRVTLLTLHSSSAEYEDVLALRRQGIEVISFHLPKIRALGNTIGALSADRPLQADYCWQPQLATDLTARLAADPTIDAVHVEHLRGARYALVAQSTLRQMGRETPVIWDSVDCISYLFRQAAASGGTHFGRYAARLDLQRTEIYEAYLIRQFDCTLVTSSVDRQALLQLASPQQETVPPLEVLPNGVDLRQFRPSESDARHESTIVFSGKMSYHANVTAAVILINEIMPMVWAKRPETRVQLVGKNPTGEVRRLGRVDRVTVTGEVASLRPYLQQASLAVAPMVYGAGIQNKVLEAMACGTPVVATPSAVAGLEAIPGRDLLVGQDPLALASMVLQLLDDRTHREDLGASGRRYVERHHDWAHIATRLEAIYANSILAIQPPQLSYTP